MDKDRGVERREREESGQEEEKKRKVCKEEVENRERNEKEREGGRKREKEEMCWKTIPLNSEMQTEELQYNAKLIIEKGSLWL